MIIDGKLVKLGKKPARLDPRTLQFKKYAAKLLPTAPSEVSWITKLAAAQALPMFLNQELGDCVEAAAAHMLQQWNFYAGHPYQPTDADVLAAYEAVGGYVPGNPSTDNGTDMLSFLKWWKNVGFAGHKIGAFLAIDWTNLQEVRLAIQWFASIFLGAGLPTWVQGLNAWTVPQGGIYSSAGQPNGWGGHCVPVCASSQQTHTCITWGTTLKMSHAFLQDYGEEAYVVLSQDWIEKDGVAPNGFDIAQLRADLNSL